MSGSIATYSFLPWLRQGVANTIKSADGDASVKARASINVSVLLSGDPVGGGTELTQTIAQDIALFGPGDVVGIDGRAVVRTEPRDWITNFESNYLPAVDFYDADFPWRYTPAAPDGSGLKLRPWIALLVLEEREFDDGKSGTSRPLPYISVANAGVFPPAGDLWAWAHVHFNESLAGSASELVSTDMNAVLGRVAANLGAHPDSGYSRLMCPRRLRDSTAYHAFVIPTFETGRLAGLGLDPAGAPHATHSAWAGYTGRPETTNYPYYHRWFFRTGTRGDFEYLVRLLKAQPVDKRVGTRNMDVRDPGSNIPAIPGPAVDGVLHLGGALRVPDQDLGATELAERQKYENWDQPYPQPFQKALAAFIDLPDDYAATDAATANAAAGATALGPGVSADPDPLITAPLYGRWHALTQRLLTERGGTPSPNTTNWVHKLNLDPRYRAAASFGTNVVETNAELYMDYAWEQIGDVLAANQLIRRLHFATEIATRWHTEHLAPLRAANPERAYMLTAPVARRVLASPTTIAHAQSASLAPPVLTGGAMRRVLRPGARLMRSLPFDGTATPHNLIARINAGEVSAAPPKVVPPGVPTVDQAAGAAEPSDVPPWIAELLAKYPFSPEALLVLAILIVIELLLSLPFRRAIALVAVFGSAVLYVYRLLQKWQAAGQAGNTLSEAGQTPQAVDLLPDSPDFVLSEPGSTVRPSTGSSDSPTAARFKSALRDSFTLVQASHAAAPTFVPRTLDLPALTTKLVAAVEPAVSIPRRGLSFISIPPWIRANLAETFDEVMAYPKIDLPMYEPLKAISVELFLPNINLIPPNSITLIETNQKFIESYMVGLNHEFARKLLWREYPTDQRGSYFRQFWDVRSHIDPEGLSGDPLKEKLYDIPELHRWSLSSSLGEHNNRAAPGETGEQAVLVIRGELLKKYPNAVIYAQRAAWVMKNAKIDPTQARTLVGDTDPPLTDPKVLRTPLYEAKADPDIYFFGFDLSVAEVKGASGDHPGDDPGWFFVIKQRPGEPRFGLELERPALEIFDELTWDDALPGGAPGAFLPAGTLGNIGLTAADPEKKVQHDDDVKVNAAAISSARWAYLLYRAPIMVAVHADEMLA
ncbi:MAG: hypothetical protein M3065_10255 [Actinomycetota bacterium]|nr:hypothetical protein [Actinomycetota bacterium]